MKKTLFLIIIFSFMILGCNNTVDSNDYFNDLERLENSEEVIEQDLYDLRIVISDINEEEYMYYMTLDNANVELNDTTILLYHDVDTKNSFPSIGYFDSPVNIGEDIKGVNLIGYLEKEPEFDFVNFKVMVKSNDFENIHTITLDRN